MNNRCKRIALLALVLTMLLSGASARAEWLFGSDAPAEPQEVSTDQTNILRVKLSSLEQPIALGLTLAGSYTVDGDKGFRFARDAEISVALSGENLLLTSGGLTIDMGRSLTLKRHQANGLNGLYIHENKHNTLYSGDLVLSAVDGAIEPVLHIDVDEYLYGVVPYEMSDSFPLEALKAQAVAARTYALSRRETNALRDYDVVDTTADQVFRGLNPDYENAIKAVDETRYTVGLYKDKYATAYFSASNGGQTAMPDQLWGYEGDYGYLDVRDDPYDLENESSVVKRLQVSADPGTTDAGIRKRLQDGLAAQGIQGDIGRIKSVTPVEPKFGDGNRMFTKIRFELDVRQSVTAEDGTVTETQVEPAPAVDLDFYNDLKPNFGLKINAANCEVASVMTNLTSDVDSTPKSFSIESRRFGHGVGMSQRGAQQMAASHEKSWLEILGFYYPGMQLCKMQYMKQPLTEIEALPASVGYARPKPTPKPTPMPLPALEEGEYYARAKLSTKSSTLNVREQPSTEAKIVGVLMNNQRLIAVKDAGEGWVQIKTAELTGFVKLEYLEKE